MRIKKLGEKVRTLRAVSGLTIREFCNEIGTNPATQVNWESGELADEALIRKMCDRFGFTFEQFVAADFPANNTEALLCMQLKTIKRVSRAARAARS